MTGKWGPLTSPDEDLPEDMALVSILFGGMVATVGWADRWNAVPNVLATAGERLARGEVNLVDLPDHLAEELDHTDLRGGAR